MCRSHHGHPDLSVIFFIRNVPESCLLLPNQLVHTFTDTLSIEYYKCVWCKRETHRSNSCKIEIVLLRNRIVPEQSYNILRIKELLKNQNIILDE
jgi:hypothetical protein